MKILTNNLEMFLNIVILKIILFMIVEIFMPYI